jgi:glutathione S-transferase
MLELENLGKADLTALSDLLGENPYLLGREPTSYDASAYSFVAHTIQPDYGSRMKRFIKTFPNLVQYWDRLTSRLYKS